MLQEVSFPLAAAYTHAPSRKISVYDYSQVVLLQSLALLLGIFLIYGLLCGYFVICAMAVWMFLYNNRNLLHKKRLDLLNILCKVKHLYFLYILCHNIYLREIFEGVLL